MPPTTKSRQLGQLIRKRREQQQLSLRQLVERVEERLESDVTIDQAYLHRLEAGTYKHPTPAILRALGEVLGLDVDRLYRLTDFGLDQDAPHHVYMRTAKGLPEEAVAKVEQYIERLQRDYGVEPPKKRGRP